VVKAYLMNARRIIGVHNAARNATDRRAAFRRIRRWWPMSTLSRPNEPREIGLSQASDRRILEYARTEGRICITLDADFHSLIAVANDIALSVIRIRQEGLRGPELAQLVLRIWPRIEAQVRQGVLVSVTAKAIRVRLLPIQRDKT
jgi:predicted nuclease of predicted toxin-antitoxin system